MIDPQHIRFAEQAASAAHSGSPVVVEAVGRIFGLSGADRDQLVSTGVPPWAFFALGITAGIVAGVRLQRKWPEAMPSLISGEK